MHTPLALITLCTGLLVLGACDEKPSRPPAPIVQTGPAEASAGAGPAASTSVPSAESVFPSASAAKLNPAAGRSNSAMSPAQESTAMPLPGQNNDHSAALGPARPASAP